MQTKHLICSLPALSLTGPVHEETAGQREQSAKKCLPGLNTLKSSHLIRRLTGTDFFEALGATVLVDFETVLDTQFLQMPLSNGEIIDFLGF